MQEYPNLYRLLREYNRASEGPGEYDWTPSEAEEATKDNYAFFVSTFPASDLKRVETTLADSAAFATLSAYILAYALAFLDLEKPPIPVGYDFEVIRIIRYIDLTL